jgi:Xaa-Pro aminopeptidase
MFPPHTYRERRKRLREQVGSGVILLLGNEESPMNYADNTYPFRQDGTFLYFFGLDEPGLAGIIDADEGTETVFGKDTTLDDIVWMGPRPALTERCRMAGVREAARPEALETACAAAVERGRKIHVLPQYRPENMLRLREVLGIEPPQLADAASVPLVRAVVAQRSVKTDEERAEIEAALDVCHDMQAEAMRLTRPGRYEREIVSAMEAIAAARGVRLSFNTIFSIHGETLHNYYHGNQMRAGDIAINDAGAESLLRYAGDITRTIPVGGTFTQRQREIYAIVLEAQEAAIAMIAPGIEYRAVHRRACEVIAAGLAEVGLMRGDRGEAVAAGAHALFFPHGIGHMLGLDVHDMESLGEDHVGYTEAIRRSPQFGLKSLRLARSLEPGFVVTVEPGIYFIPALIDRWKAERRHENFVNYPVVETYKNFGGIRIEDDVIVLRDGRQILGKPIPKAIDEVQDLTRG